MPSPALWALHATLPVLQPPTRWAPGLRGGVGGQSHGCCRASAPPRSELEPVPLGFATWRPCWPPSLLASVEVPSRAHTPTRAFPGPVSPPANACGSVPRRWSCLSPPGPPSSWCCGRRPRFPLPEGQGGLAGGWGGPCSARSMAPGLCPGPWQGVAVPSRAVRDSASLDRQGRPVPPSGRWTVVWCGLSPCGPSCTCLSRAGAVGGGACGRAGPSLGRRHRRWTPRPSLCVGSGKPSWPVASGRSLVTLVPARDTCEAVLRWRPHKWHHLVAARWRRREQSGLGNRYLDHLLLSPAGKLRQRGSGASPGSPTGKRQAQPGAGRPSRCSGRPLGGGGAQQGHSG